MYVKPCVRVSIGFILLLWVLFIIIFDDEIDEIQRLVRFLAFIIPLYMFLNYLETI